MIGNTNMDNLAKYKLVSAMADYGRDFDSRVDLMPLSAFLQTISPRFAADAQAKLDHHYVIEQIIGAIPIKGCMRDAYQQRNECLNFFYKSVSDAEYLFAALNTHAHEIYSLPTNLMEIGNTLANIQALVMEYKIKKIIPPSEIDNSEWYYASIDNILDEIERIGNCLDLKLSESSFLERMRFGHTL